VKARFEGFRGVLGPQFVGWDLQGGWEGGATVARWKTCKSSIHESAVPMRFRLCYRSLTVSWQEQCTSADRTKRHIPPPNGGILEHWRATKTSQTFQTQNAESLAE